MYKGTLRDFVGQEENSIDVKTGLTRSEITSKKHTIIELNDLLDSVENKTVQFHKRDAW
jgi:hypothetical protein